MEDEGDGGLYEGNRVKRLLRKVEPNHRRMSRRNKFILHTMDMRRFSGVTEVPSIPSDWCELGHYSTIGTGIMIRIRCRINRGQFRVRSDWFTNSVRRQHVSL